MSNSSRLKKIFKTLLIYSTAMLVLLIMFSWWQTSGQSSSTLNIAQLQNQYPQLKTTPVVLRFITTDCPICAFENDNVERAENLGGVNLVNVIVNSTERDARAYLTKSNLNQNKFINDPNSTVFKQFSGKAVPLTVFIGSDNQVHHLTLGYTTTLGLIIRYWISHF